MSFLALSARESSLVQTFCESCVRLDITHQSVHMARRFVIQGCPTLTAKFYPSATLPTLEKVYLIFPLDHMYDHIYIMYTTQCTHKSVISVVHTMTTMYLCMATAVSSLLSNLCLLFITECGSIPSSRWQRH